MKSRRSVLTGAATLGSVALAGCGFLGESGGAETDVYTDWWPQSNDGSNPGFFYGKVASLSSSDLARRYASNVPGADPEEIEYLVDTTATVFHGTFDPESVREAFTDRIQRGLPSEPEQEHDTYRGFERYTVSDGGSADKCVGFRDGTGILADRPSFERIVDVREGDEPVVTSVDEDAATLVDELGTGDVVVGGLPQGDRNSRNGPENVVAEGERRDVRSESTEFLSVSVFESAGDADEQAVRESISPTLLRSGPSVSKSGRIVRAQYTVGHR